MIYRIALALVFIHVVVIVFFTYYLTSQKKYDFESAEISQGCSEGDSPLLESNKVLSGLPRIVEKYSVEGETATLSNQYGYTGLYQIVKNTELTRVFFSGDQYSFGLELSVVPSFQGSEKSTLCVVSMLFSQNSDEGQLAWFLRRRSFKQSLIDFSRTALKK